MKIVLQIDSFDGYENLFEKQKEFTIVDLSDPIVNEIIEYGLSLRKLAIKTNNRWSVEGVSGHCYLNITVDGEEDSEIAFRIDATIIYFYEQEYPPIPNLPKSCPDCGRGTQNFSPKNGGINVFCGGCNSHYTNFHKKDENDNYGDPEWISKSDWDKYIN